MVTKRLRLGLITAVVAVALPGGAAYAQPVGDQPEETPPPEEAPPAETPPPEEAPPAETPPPAETAPEEAVPEEAPPETTEVEATEEETEGEVIIITGSMIARKQTSTVAPLAVVDKAELDAAGMASVGEILQNLPAQGNGINVQFNNGGDGSTRISLRNLGSIRTLVLVNGRRHVYGGTGADASVDLNAIPIAIIDRVEVLKDGASAIYGSDAIGGVVNIITRQDYEGTEASIYTGTTQRNDGFTYDLSMVHGMKSDKGSFMVSAGFFNQNEVMAGDRAYSARDKVYDYACAADETNPERNTGVYHPTFNENGCVFESGSTATPEGTIIDYGEGASPEWDAVNASNADCAANVGVWVVDSSPIGVHCFDFNGNSDGSEYSDTPVGDFYNYQPENYLYTPQKRYNLYSQGRWHLAKEGKVDAFFETSYMRRKSDQLLAPEPLFTVTEGLVVSADNIYNPYNRDFIDIRRRLVEFDRRKFAQDIDTFRLVTGVDGEITKDWRWQANYNFGRTGALFTKRGLLRLSKLASALGPSYTDETGAHCGTVGNEIDGCVPLNLFGGPGSITQDMIAGLTYTGIGRGYTMMNMGQVTANGKLVDLGDGGDIRLAVGGEFRRVRGEYIPDPLTAAGDTSGNKGEPTSGYYEVFEGFGEVSVVPFVGKPFAEWLELNVAARGFNYNTFGSGATFKGGVLWRHNSGVGLRGTAGNAFRAPSIGELYSGNFDDFPAVTDPCDTSMGPRSPSAQAQCSAQGIPDDFTDPRTQHLARAGGNPEVEPETANIFTAGAVYQPKMVEGLALTLDYFWAEITDSIQRAGAGTLLSNCYNTTTPTDCDKINRDPTTHLIVNIEDTVTNIGGSKTSGLDFQVRYDWKHLTAGRFRHNLEGTYLLKYNDYFPTAPGPGFPNGQRVVEGVGTYDIGHLPRLKLNFGTMWARDAFGAGVNVRYMTGLTECQDLDCDTYLEEGNPAFDDTLQRSVEANITGDIFVQYAIKSPAGTSALTLGMNNVLDQDPPFIYDGFYADSDASAYDFLGRYFYARYTQSY